jgi:RNA-binding protein
MNEKNEAKPPKKSPVRDLTSKQKSYLRGLAHHLEPLVKVGKDGLTEGVSAALTAVLDQHELVKVRVLESAPTSRAEAAEPLARATGAYVVGGVGRIIILYRRNQDTPLIELPR